MAFYGIALIHVTLICCALLVEGKIILDDSAATCDFPAIYNFGDSNSDTGGISAAFYPMITPCGDTYFHRPAGRASDGRLIIDFLGNTNIYILYVTHDLTNCFLILTRMLYIYIYNI